MDVTAPFYRSPDRTDNKPFTSYHWGNLLLPTLLLLISLISMPIWALDSGHATEGDFYTELPVVLHAARLRQSVNAAPAAVTVIDREMIDASTATTIPELLRYVPGFQLSYKNSHELIPAFHGLADDYSRRVQVLIDGRATYSQGSMGSITWSTLPIDIDDVERIEVVRSPNAATYGAAAYLGSINIVTRGVTGAIETSSRLDIGSNERISGSVRHSGEHEELYYMLSTRYEQNSGFSNRHDDLNSAFLNFRGDWRLTTRDKIEFAIGYGNTNGETGFDGELYAPLRERKINSHYQRLSWRHINAADDEWQLSLYHNHHAVENPLSDDYPDETVAGKDIGFSSDRYSVELQRIQRINENFRLAWGAGASYDLVSVPWFYDYFDTQPVKEQEKRLQWQLFANAEWQLTPSLLLNLGISYENPDWDGSHVSSRVGLNYQVNQDHSLRAIVSRSNRPPSLYEDFSDPEFIYGDPFAPLDNDPGSETESVKTIELGYFGRFSDQRLTLDVNLFYNHFNTLILKLDDLEPDLYEKLSLYERAGLDAQISYRGEHDLLSLSYSYVKSLDSDEINDGDGSYDLVSMYVPEHILSLLYSHHFDSGWTVSSSLFHVDTVRWNYDAGNEKATTWADLKIAKSFKTAGGDVDLAITLQNVLDEPGVTLRESSNAPTKGGRQFLATLRHRF